MDTTYTISAGSKVLLLEDSIERIHWFRQRIKTNLWITSSVEEAIEWTQIHRFDVFFLDHDLSEEHYREDSTSDTTGTAFCKFLRDQGYTGVNMVIHSWNMSGRRRMNELLPESTKALFGTFDVRVK